MHFAPGCSSPDKESPLLAEIEQLTNEKKQLQKQLNQTKDQNEDLEKRNQVLAGLPEDVKGENLYSIHSIKITKYTNLYDKDKDGKKEKLIVYIQPIDQDGDIIKAAGAVEVQLLDWDNKNIGQWQVTTRQLKKLWFATVVKTNYRLTFDIAGKLEDPKEPLTVKVAFTDHLTGKVFKEQSEIKPR